MRVRVILITISMTLTFFWASPGGVTQAGVPSELLDWDRLAPLPDAGGKAAGGGI